MLEVGQNGFNYVIFCRYITDRIAKINFCSDMVGIGQEYSKHIEIGMVL